MVAIPMLLYFEPLWGIDMENVRYDSYLYRRTVDALFHVCIPSKQRRHILIAIPGNKIRLKLIKFPKSKNVVKLQIFFTFYITI